MGLWESCPYMYSETLLLMVCYNSYSNSILILNESKSSNPTDLIPLGIRAAHQQHTQRVGFGADVFIQEIVTGHSQLHLGYTLSSHGVTGSEL